MHLTTNLSAQKKWQKPQFYLIDQDHVNGGGPVGGWREVSETASHAFKVQKVPGGTFGYAAKSFYDAVQLHS